MGRFTKLETGKKPGQEPTPEAPPPQALDPSEVYAPDSQQASDEHLDVGGCLRAGDEALFRNDWKAALRWYSRGIDKDSTLIQPWAAMIRVLLLRGELKEAYTWIGRGLTIFPNSPHLLALRSVVYARRGMMRQAINNSDAVLEQNGTLPLAHLARGEVLLLADNKNADYCFEQCLKLCRVDDWQTPFIIGLIHEERRLWAKAIQYYAKVAEHDERNAALWYHVGLCRAEMGQRPHAEKAFERAAQFCPPGDAFIIKIEHAKPGTVWKRVANIFRKK